MSGEHDSVPKMHR